MSRKLRVVFVDHSSILGGGQLGLLRYLNHESDYRRSVITFGEGDLSHRLRSLGIEVTVLPAADNKLRKLLAPLRLRRALRESGADLIVANSLTAANIVALSVPALSKSFAYLREDLTTQSVRPGLKRFLMTRILLRRFDAFIANSGFTASSIPASLLSKPCAVAYPVSGINDAAAVELPVGELRVISLSRLAEWKGIHTLVDAAALINARGFSREISFIIAGDSSHADPGYGESLRTRAARLLPNVHFVGRVDDPLALLDTGHILALCSIRPEPFGQVLPQALIRGRLVIATEGGGADEILEGGRWGLSVPPGDPEALASVLVELCQDRRRLVDYASEAPTRGRDFLDETTARSLDRAIAVLMQGDDDDDNA